jgi:hypothetical protein
VLPFVRRRELGDRRVYITAFSFTLLPVTNRAWHLAIGMPAFHYNFQTPPFRGSCSEVADNLGGGRTVADNSGQDCPSCGIDGQSVAIKGFKAAKSGGSKAAKFRGFRTLERFKKYCSHSARDIEEAVFLIFRFVSAQLQGLSNLRLHRSLAKNQKSSLRIGYTIF